MSSGFESVQNVIVAGSAILIRNIPEDIRFEGEQ